MGTKRTPPLEDQLRSAIRESGLFLNRIAQGAKWDGGTLSQFMLGRQKSIRLKTAQRVAKVLGLRFVLEPIPERETRRKKKTASRSTGKTRRRKTTR